MIKRPNGASAARARKILMVKKLKTCTLSMLVCYLELDKQCPFYMLS